MKTSTKAATAILVVAAVAAVIVGLCFGGFILAKDSADRSTDVQRNSAQYRTTTETSIR